MRYAAWLACVCCLWLVAGCIQRVDADLPVTARRADVLLNWTKVGVFGGTASIVVNSDDPFQIRYETGKFMRIAGVCATDKEVWVCDTGLSRIQVFDFDGNFLRSYGTGAPLDRILITDQELSQQQTDRRKIKQTWQDGPGKPFTNAERTLFKAADVQVTPDGYWMVDQVMSDAGIGADRSPGFVYIPFIGDGIKRIDEPQMPWLEYLALSNGILAASSPQRNNIMMADSNKPKPPTRRAGAETQYLNIVRMRKNWSKEPGYEQLERKVTGASVQPGQYYYPCGLAIAFDKIAVCDTYNHRIQILDGRNHGVYWGKVLRLIMPRKLDGSMRFDIPLDIDIATNGQSYVLDAGRNEVALLSSDFERLGSFARDEMALPWALDLSDDGRHIFITDQRTNQVYHYAAQD